MSWYPPGNKSASKRLRCSRKNGGRGLRRYLDVRTIVLSLVTRALGTIQRRGESQVRTKQKTKANGDSRPGEVETSFCGTLTFLLLAL